MSQPLPFRLHECGPSQLLCLFSVSVSNLFYSHCFGAHRCQVCAFRWGGQAGQWKYTDLSEATSFVWYVSLPPPKPSGLCPQCATNPPSPSSLATISNGLFTAIFDGRGLQSFSTAGFNVSIGNDAFALGLDGKNCTCSSSLSDPTMQRLAANAISFIFMSPAQNLVVNVTHELWPNATFVTKTMELTDTSGSKLTRQVNSVTAMDGANLQSQSKGARDTRTSQNVQFFRWSAPQPSRTLGAFMTAQNSLVKPPSLTWQPDQNWTTLDSNGNATTRRLDSAIVGLYNGQTSQLELAEAAAVTNAVSHFLVRLPSTIVQ